MTDSWEKCHREWTSTSLTLLGKKTLVMQGTSGGAIYSQTRPQVCLHVCTQLPGFAGLSLDDRWMWVKQKVVSGLIDHAPLAQNSHLNLMEDYCSSIVCEC